MAKKTSHKKKYGAIAIVASVLVFLGMIYLFAPHSVHEQVFLGFGMEHIFLLGLGTATLAFGVVLMLWLAWKTFEK